MKKNPNIIDKSAPYRNLGLDKITAPTKPENEPKNRIIKGEGDLRVKGGKK
ncbi:MAG: hypothetical protein IJW02_02405 [Clostridia bacterium]|nr:hypothetical protein [Clostridia bacterium]